MSDTHKTGETTNGATASLENGTTAEDNSEKPVDEQKTDEMFSIEWLRKYFAKSLGIYYGPKPEVLLDEISFEGIARYIQSDRCQKIVTMVGAGISTAAGLPDFRTPGSGLYAKLAKYNLQRPEQAFDINFFKENPEPYYMIRREMFAANIKPTASHYFVKLLENKNKLLRHFTQNIDGLERDAGISEDRLVEAHGSYRTSHCMKCNKLFDKDWCIDKMFDQDTESPVPYCDIPDCRGVIKPDVVFFGESLPKRFAERVQDLEHCDMLIILGTSLVVQPFNTITNRTKDNTPRLYINMENAVGGKRHPISVLFFGGGFDFGQEDNIRDVYWQGKCDDGCYGLADLIGWGDELREMMKREHDRIDQEWKAAGKKPYVPEMPNALNPSSDSKPKTNQTVKQSTHTTQHGTRAKASGSNQGYQRKPATPQTAGQGPKSASRTSLPNKDKSTTRSSSTTKGPGLTTKNQRSSASKKQ